MSIPLSVFDMREDIKVFYLMLENATEKNRNIFFLNNRKQKTCH